MILLGKIRSKPVLMTRWLATLISLSAIGLGMGISCVLLPTGVQIAIIGIASLLLLWVMPDLNAIPERFTRFMYYPFLVSNISIPIYFALAFEGIPQVSIRRIILIIFAAPFVLTLAGASSQRRALMEKLRSANSVLVLTACFYIILWITALGSVKFVYSFSTVINDSLIWFVPFIATIVLVQKRNDVQSVLLALSFALAFNFLIGLVETVLHHPFLIYAIPQSMRDKILEQSPGSIVLFQGVGLRNGLYRSASTFNVPLSWGESAAMLSPFGAHFLADGNTRTARLYGATIVGIGFASIVLSGSRGAYIGFIGSAILFMFLWAMRKTRNEKGSLAGGFAIILSLMGSLAVTLAIYFVGRLHRVVLGGGAVQSSNDARAAEWALAQPKILARPLFGYGPGTSGEVIGYYGYASYPSVDSYVMTLLVENGVVGFIVFFGIIAACIVISARIYLRHQSPVSSVGNALASSMLAFAIYRLTLSQLENHTTFFSLVGLVAAVSYIDKQGLRQARTRTSS